MTKYPLYSLIALIIFISAAVMLLIFGDASNAETITIISVMLANIPALVASFMSERNNNAIQNGTVVEKAKQGAVQAIQEQQVMTRTGPVETTQLRALTELLDRMQNVEGRTTTLETDKPNGPTL